MLYEKLVSTVLRTQNMCCVLCFEYISLETGDYAMLGGGKCRLILI